MRANKLIELYPDIFKDFESFNNIGDGWFSILEHLCSAVSLHCKETNLDFSFLRMQNKFGTLIIERRGDDSFTHMVNRFAERLSFKTCEQCGKKGMLHSSNGTQFGKQATLCEFDALQKLYRKI